MESRLPVTLPPQTNMPDQNLATRAQELHLAGQYLEAARLYRDLLGRYSDNAQLHTLLGASLLSMGHFDEAKDAFQTSLQIEPDDLGTIVQCARATFLSGDLEHGRELLESAKNQQHDASEVLVCQAEFALLDKQYQQACDILHEHVQGESPDISLVLTYVRALQRAQSPEVCIPVLRKQADRADLSKKNRRQIATRLANLLDRAGRYDEAFEWIMIANKTARHSQHMQMLQQFMNDVTSTTTRPKCDTLPTSAIDDPAPVFVVGMPRAGTTLLEHTVAAHPQAHGMGELMAIGEIAERLYGWNSPGIPRIERMRLVNPQSLEREASAHLANLREGAGDALCIVDKMPNNFFLLPIIKQLYPKARILHAKRSPRDTCLSCLFNLDPHNHWYTTHLDELGVFYNHYDRLMSHWKRVLDMPILDVPYERMVLDRDATVREILAFLDLPWDEACLSQEKQQRTVYTGSFEQAQRAIYTTSLQRWKHYEAHLKPLLNVLQVPEPDPGALLPTKK